MESKNSKRKSTGGSDSESETKKQKTTTTNSTSNSNLNTTPAIILPVVPEAIMADIMTMGSGEVGQLGFGKNIHNVNF